MFIQMQSISCMLMTTTKSGYIGPAYFQALIFIMWEKVLGSIPSAGMLVDQDASSLDQPHLDL